MEGGVFFKELRMEGVRGSGGPASHTDTFPDLVPPRINAYQTQEPHYMH